MTASVEFRRILYSAVILAALLAQLALALLGWSGLSPSYPQFQGMLASTALASALLLMREIRRPDPARHALAASEERFRDFAASSSDWLWESDAEHRFTWFS